LQRGRRVGERFMMAVKSKRTSALMDKNKEEIE
jgi:hypothetical protein